MTPRSRKSTEVNDGHEEGQVSQTGKLAIAAPDAPTFSDREYVHKKWYSPGSVGLL
jgi:hypothetical protein